MASSVPPEKISKTSFESEVVDDDDDDDDEFLAEYYKRLNATNEYDVDVFPKDGKFPPIGCIVPIPDLHKQKTIANFFSYLSYLAISKYNCHPLIPLEGNLQKKGNYSFDEVVKANTRVVAKCEYYTTFKAEDAIEDYNCEYFITFKAEDVIEGNKTFQALVWHGLGKYKVISCDLKTSFNSSPSQQPLSNAEIEQLMAETKPTKLGPCWLSHKDDEDEDESEVEIEQLMAETKPTKLGPCWLSHKDDEDEDESEVEIEQLMAETKPTWIRPFWQHSDDDDDESEDGDDSDTNNESYFDHEFLAKYCEHLNATNEFDVDVSPKDDKCPPFGCIIPIHDLHNQNTTLYLVSYLSDLAIRKYNCQHKVNYSFDEVVKANTRCVPKCEYYITFKAEDAIEGYKTFHALVLHGIGEYEVISCDLKTTN